MDGTKQKDLNRREFLKLSTTTVAILAVGEKLVGRRTRHPFVSAASQNQTAESIVPSYCKMCIGPACGMLAHIQDGIVSYVEGDPQHLANEGKLCPRGNSNVFNLYNPYRLKSPLKRTNPEKGMDIDPGWMEIGWDEALGTVTQKLQEIMDDPRQLVWHLGFGSMRDDSPMGRPVFQAAFGTPNDIQSNGPLCPVHFGALAGFGSFTYSWDPTRANYLVCIGHSPGGEFAKASCATGLHGVSSSALQNAFDRGLKMVVVNPHAGPETKRAEWVPIIPGTELAFMLALGNVIVHEIGKLDEWFLRVRSNAPYLIKPDGTYTRDPSTSKPLVWDPAAGKAVPFDDPAVANGSLLDPALGQVALTGEYEVNGEKVRPAFELIRDSLESTTPEWAQEITSIPADKIRQIAADFVEASQIGSTIEINGFKFPYRPATIFAGRGAISHRGGNYVMLAGNLLNGLVGACDVPGGMTGESFNPLPAPGVDGTIEPNVRMIPQTEEWIRNEFKLPVDHLDLAEFYPHKHSTDFVAWRSIVDPQKYHVGYTPKVMCVFGANPLTNNVLMDEAVAAFKTVPFTFTISYHLDEPTQFADIVLAESANMERLNYIEFQSCGPEAGKRGMRGLNFRHPVVGPIYNTRDGNTVLLELLNRLGIHPKAQGMMNGMLRLAETPFALEPPKPYTWEEIVDRILKARFGEDKGVEYFKEHGSAWTMQWIPEEKTYNYFYFPDNKTRYPIYMEYLLNSGYIMKGLCEQNNVTVPGWDMEKYLAFFGALPTWIPHPEHEASPEYDLFAVNWKIATRVFGMGAFEEITPIREMQLIQSPEANAVLVNTETAHQKGINEGDEVIVESQYGGKQKGVVHLTETLHPKAVGFPGNFGRTAMFMGPEARKGVNYNQLLSAADGEFDPVIGAIEITSAIRLVKA